MKWIGAFGALVMLILAAGCPSGSPNSPGGNTPTPTVTATPTATCIGSFGEPVTNSGFNLGTTYTAASAFTLAETAAVTAISIPMSGDETFRVGIYSNSLGAPQSVLAVSASTAAVALWNTVSLGPVTLAPGVYWLAIRVTDNPTGNTGYGDGVTGDLHLCACDFADPWVPGTIFTTNHLTILANYSCP